jgi:hypothetical protein
MTYVIRLADYIEDLRAEVQNLIAREWDKGRILDSDQLPQWWTEDRPDLLRANVEQVYEELIRQAGTP